MATIVRDSRTPRLLNSAAGVPTPYGQAVIADRDATRTRARRAADLGHDVTDKIRNLELFRVAKRAELDAAVNAEIFRVLEAG